MGRLLTFLWAVTRIREQPITENALPSTSRRASGIQGLVLLLPQVVNKQTLLTNEFQKTSYLFLFYEQLARETKFMKHAFYFWVGVTGYICQQSLLPLKCVPFLALLTFSLLATLKNVFCFCIWFYKLQLWSISKTQGGPKGLLSTVKGTKCWVI